VALLAAAAAVVLLAAGLGVLGGKGPAASAQASASPAALATLAGPTSTPVPPFSEVVPLAPCKEATVLPPVVSLVVDDQPFEAPADPQADRPTVQVPAEARTAVHVEGDVCALAWQIALDGGTILDELGNRRMDPAYASQNWFPLSLYDFRGRDGVLIATLLFGGPAVTASWSIHVGEFEPPAATLSTSAKAGAVTLAPGCDMLLTLRGGIVDLSDPTCTRHIATLLEPAALPIDPGGPLAFQLGDWDIDHGDVRCGRLEDGEFVVDPDCGPSPGGFLGTIEFDAPARPGVWVLAIEACAQEDRGAANPITLCGTWYGSVEVRA